MSRLTCSRLRANKGGTDTEAEKSESVGRGWGWIGSREEADRLARRGSSVVARGGEQGSRVAGWVGSGEEVVQLARQGSSTAAQAGGGLAQVTCLRLGKERGEVGDRWSADKAWLQRSGMGGL